MLREKGRWCLHTTKSNSLLDKTQRGAAAWPRSHSAGTHVLTDLRICLWICLLPCQERAPTGRRTRSSQQGQEWRAGLGPWLWAIFPNRLLGLPSLLVSLLTSCPSSPCGNNTKLTDTIYYILRTLYMHTHIKSHLTVPQIL